MKGRTFRTESVIKLILDKAVVEFQHPGFGFLYPNQRDALFMGERG